MDSKSYDNEKEIIDNMMMVESKAMDANEEVEYFQKLYQRFINDPDIKTLLVDNGAENKKDIKVWLDIFNSTNIDLVDAILHPNRDHGNIKVK